VVGNAAIVGNNIVVTLHKSNANEFGLIVSTTNVNLDISSLIGTYQSIIQNYNNEFAPLQHVSGIARFSTCDTNTKSRCEINGGYWYENYSECYAISEGACQILGGQFDPCGTCRDMPPDLACAAVCIPYCAF